MDEASGQLLQTDLDRSTPKALSLVLSEAGLKPTVRAINVSTPEERAARAAKFDSERAERDAAEARKAQLRKAGEAFRVFAKSAGERYVNATLDTFQATTDRQRKVLAGLREYLDTDAQRSVLLYGPCGTGKDHLAIALIRELARKHLLTAHRINGPEWFGYLRDRISADRPEADIIKELALPDVLLLSDPLPPMGALTEFQASMLYRVVDARYTAGRITITTVNVKDGQEAVGRMGAAIWDRLKDGAWVVGCNWPSHRRPAREV